jgi:hypothetical protein
MRGLWVAAAVVLVLGVATPALPSGAHVDKKKCRWVVKKIHGKKKRVRVCTKIKPKPKPPAPKPPTPKPPTSTVPPPGYFPRPANPLKVSLELDTGHTASATIGSTGGSLSATAESGTRFTLTIPAKALLDDERVTMTPVSSIGGFPFSGGLIGAVEIQPHGLQLLQAATLTIQPAGSAPTDGRSGFLAHEAGEDFHLYPLGSGGSITMRLTHFSTPGVGVATAGELANVLSHMPVRTAAQYESLMAEQVKKLDGSATDADLDAIAGTFAAYYRDIVKPLVDKAVSDDSYAASAVAELLSWARQLELIGLADHRFVETLHDGVMEKVAIILRNAINKSYARCANHDLSEIVRLISYERQMQILGLEEGDALGKAQKCARFEVDYDTRVTAPLHVVGPAGAGLTCCPYAQVEETAQDVQLTLTSDFKLSGTKQHESVSGQPFNAFPETCWVASSMSTPFSEPLKVLDLGFDYNVKERKLPDGRIVRDVSPSAVAMFMSPGGIQFQWHFVPSRDDAYCTGTQDGAMHSGIPWSLAVEQIDGVGPGGAHFYEFVPFVGLNEFGWAWELTDWGAPSGALIGRKTYQFSAPTDDDRIVIAEETSISLFHRPA